MREWEKEGPRKQNWSSDYLKANRTVTQRNKTVTFPLPYATLRNITRTLTRLRSHSDWLVRLQLLQTEKLQELYWRDISFLRLAELSSCTNLCHQRKKLQLQLYLHNFPILKKSRNWTKQNIQKSGQQLCYWHLFFLPEKKDHNHVNT